MYTAGQRVLLTITGPGLSFFHTYINAEQRTQREHVLLDVLCKAETLGCLLRSPEAS